MEKHARKNADGLIYSQLSQENFILFNEYSNSKQTCEEKNVLQKTNQFNALKMQRKNANVLKICADSLT